MLLDVTLLAGIPANLKAYSSPQAATLSVHRHFHILNAGFQLHTSVATVSPVSSLIMAQAHHCINSRRKRLSLASTKATNVGLCCFTCSRLGSPSWTSASLNVSNTRLSISAGLATSHLCVVTSFPLNTAEQRNSNSKFAMTSKRRLPARKQTPQSLAGSQAGYHCRLMVASL